MGRKPAPITPEQEQLLTQLGDLAEQRRRIDQEYVALTLATHSAGATLSEIARRCGVSDEAVRKLILRNHPTRLGDDQSRATCVTIGGASSTRPENLSEHQ